MSSNALTLAKDLKGMLPNKVVTDERVRNQFAYIYNSVHGEGGEAAYNRESLYFVQQIKASPQLQKCTGPSIFYAFIDLAVKGLSLQPGTQAQAYLLPRSVRTGRDPRGNDVYETTCNLTISGYGELYLRKAAGQILYADNPVIVYEGDDFEFGERDGKKYVNYGARFPRQTNRIVACFVRIVRTDGSVDYSVMTEPDWLRLADYSKKQNRGKVNDLYVSNGGQIDSGFLVAKTVKHAFKTYPRIAIGRGSAFAADVPEEQPGFDPYDGVDAAIDGGPQEDLPQDEPQDFAPQQDYSGGVKYTEPEDDDTF